MSLCFINLVFTGKSGFVFNDCSSVYFISYKHLTVLFYILQLQLIFWCPLCQAIHSARCSGQQGLCTSQPVTFHSSPDTTVVLHQVYTVPLGLLSRAKLYVDATVHGTTKLVPYFSFMTYCLISKTEKLMFSTYFMDLWNLFNCF